MERKESGAEVYSFSREAESCISLTLDIALVSLQVKTCFHMPKVLDYAKYSKFLPRLSVILILSSTIE